MRKRMRRSGDFFIYIICAKDGTFYTGYTNNLTRRIKEHATGRGARYLKGKTPLTLVYVKKVRYYKVAIDEEKRIKRMTRRQKEVLVKTYTGTVIV